jgi:integrase
LTHEKYLEVLSKYSEYYSPEQVEKFHCHVHHTIKKAVKQHLLIVDIAMLDNREKLGGDLTKIKPKASKFKTPNEAKRIIEFCQKNLDEEIHLPVYHCIFTAIETAMRYAELCGLTWKYVDFDSQIITVYQGYDYKHNTGFIPLKGYEVIGDGARNVPMSDDLRIALQQLKIKQEILLKQLDIKNSNNLVFFSVFNTFISNNTSNNYLKSLQKELGIEDEISMHGCRHTAISLWLYDLTIHQVADLAGDTIATIEKTYKHILKELETKKFLAKAKETMDSLSKCEGNLPAGNVVPFPQKRMTRKSS